MALSIALSLYLFGSSRMSLVLEAMACMKIHGTWKKDGRISRSALLR